MTAIILFWKKLQLATKIMLVINIALIIAVFYFKTTYSIFKNKYVNELEQQQETLQENLQTSKLRILQLTQKGQIRTKSIKKALTKIDEKQKKDEATIDSTTISDNDILVFAKRYER